MLRLPAAPRLRLAIPKEEKQEMKKIQVIPAAGRLVRSLRDLGYDFPQAVADLVDNSIAADARRITIDLRFEGPDSWLRIADDGHGMTPTEITETNSWPPYRLPDGSALRAAMGSAAAEAMGRPVPAQVCGPSNIGNLLAASGIEATCGFGVRRRPSAHPA